jgi:hypothetical protein
MMGQLPRERVTPGCVFEKVGVDYAGPFLVKYGMVRRPTLVKAYVCIFVSLAVKAVHIEVVSDLTAEAFIATLRRFIARRGHPALIWSDNGTNFVGANRELKELYNFLDDQKNRGAVSEFCSARNVEWRFIPEHSPNFGGLWEACVKSAKTHLKRIMGSIRFTYEELTTVLSQVEACLNSRPLIPADSRDVDGIDVLTLPASVIPTKWPLAKVVQVHSGRDGLLHVATLKTGKGTYKRPVSKIALLLPNTEL